MQKLLKCTTLHSFTPEIRLAESSGATGQTKQLVQIKGVQSDKGKTMPDIKTSYKINKLASDTHKSVLHFPAKRLIKRKLNHHETTLHYKRATICISSTPS